MRLELGLIGATGIAERTVVAPSRAVPGVSPVAVAASDPDRAAAFAERHGLRRAHRDYAALVEDPEVGAVYVSLHNSAHHRWASAAARAGKHVLVEKPLCLTAAEAADLAAAAAEGGVHVVEAVPTAGHAWQREVRAAVLDHRWGPLRAVRTRIRFAPPAPGGFRLRPDLGGGVFRDSACYWTQAVQATAGLAGAHGGGKAVRDVPGGVDVGFAAHLDLPGGVRAELDCAFGDRHVAEHEFRFDQALVRVRGFLRPIAGALPLNLTVRHADGRSRVRSFPPVSYYDRQLRRFHALVADGVGPGGELAAAAERVRLMEQIHDDAEEAG
ncbi:Gfo/Idh/MocA family protein [Saccharothrix yanglingensis]|uniref:Oxidoreductase n=1 Tax=Saccharothrix yanglingensis TaxID=659496 RepID=A0ABU0X3J1_9PSEU|nr:Gfo/Idh/MocA family oxidoreductase [Saccharothrix yanglingensis]MDQ2586688.1 oxidoreductase [Saccharothrix yanglingensis]